MAHPYDDRYRDEDRGQRGYGRDDRNFFERAGDEVRSWFGRDDMDHGRHGGDRGHHERMTSERGWTGAERSHEHDRWRNEPDRWRAESDRPRGDADRWRSEPEYGRSTRAWNEPGYGRWPDEGRPTTNERWRAGEGSRDYGDRWRSESGGMWGPATWSQEERWRRESGDRGDRYGDRWTRESNWGAWPREEGSWGPRRGGESRGYYEDDRGMTHQFAHRETGERHGGMGRAMGYSGRGPKNYRRSDERIREEICDRLTDDWRVDASDMEVTVNNGQVTLAGSVHSRDEKRKAEDLVESIPGVHDVLNNLRVTAWDDNRDGVGATTGSSMTGSTSGMNTAANQGNTTAPATRR
jgi:hypothetical protein